MSQTRSSLTTLCYLEKDGKWLMLHRIKKKNDVNQDKWIGVGGHAEDYESPEDCLLREVYEETGLRLTEYRFRGIVTFALKDVETQYMCLYTATGWEGELLSDCREGDLEWVPKTAVNDLELWEGDKVFFQLMAQNHPFFSLKLGYEKDDLKECVLDGKALDWKAFLASEYLDIVGEDGEPTGMCEERSRVHAQGDLHRTSHVWIVREKQGELQILVQKRSQNKDSFPGCYDISSAGHIPAGEGFEESAVRELFEELGIRADSSELVFCGTRRIHWEDVFHGKPFIDNQVSRVYLLWRDLEAAQMKLQESEISEVRWFPFRKLVRLVAENAIPHCIFSEELSMIEKNLKSSC